MAVEQPGYIHRQPEAVDGKLVIVRDYKDYSLALTAQPVLGVAIRAMVYKLLRQD
ncbi:hypothetical protein [Spirosoma sp. KNUC1025]|uniref:hypothetical protein n=1 Tax=Spirosoma sp. KNUC1025 TaxID=2894082 RepID=UPI00386CBC72|nr:hypothetical protein LN737_29655 [Spirosoma sp. KNUC1025]